MINETIASSILRQILAKIQEELFRISIPTFQETLVIGVDVIMNGNGFLIGCCSTTSDTLTQIHSKVYKQNLPKIGYRDMEFYVNKSKKEVQEILLTEERAQILEDFII